MLVNGKKNCVGKADKKQSHKGTKKKKKKCFNFSLIIFAKLYMICIVIKANNYRVMFHIIITCTYTIFNSKNIIK